MGSRKRLAARKLALVGELPLVGGSLCLDLANTTGARGTPEPRERLRSYDDLLVWSRRAGALGAADVSRLGAAGSRRRAAATAALERVRSVREEIYRVFRAVAESRVAPPATLKRLGELWRAERDRRDLVPEGDAFALRLRVGPVELDAMLWPVVADAVDLLTSDRLRHLKRCGECDWLFLDATKNGSRTWCKKQCGDRIRARRHYDRKRERT